MIETKFKQTELGPIPEDWDVTPISKCLSFGNGRDYKHLDSGIYPVYGTGGLITHINDFLYEGESVCIGRKGSIDKPQFHSGRFWTVDTLYYTHSFNDVIPKYVYYCFLCINWRSLNEASGVPSLSQRIIGGQYIRVASSVYEQRKIAEALSDIDALIRELDTLLEKKRSIMQGTMQDLLTARRRLPGFNEPWKNIIFGNVVDIYRGGSPRPIDSFITTNPNGLNWIKIGDVRPNDKYITHTAEKIMPEGLPATRMVYAGDFILSNSMSFGRPYLLKIDGCIHDGWLAITKYESSFDKDFLYYLLGANFAYRQYTTLAAGSGVLNLNKKVVGDVELTVPMIDEQQAIASILSDMDVEIEELEAKRDKYIAVRQCMMQQLLTGKIRLI